MSRSYPDRPIVGVGAVVCHDDRVLLIRRGKPPKRDEWSIPGGAQTLGETVFDAAAREVREETGLDVNVVGLIDVVDFIDRDGADTIRHHYTLVDVLALWRAGQARAGDDAAEVRWATFDEAARLPMWSQTARIIAAARDLLGAQPAAEGLDDGG